MFFTNFAVNGFVFPARAGDDNSRYLRRTTLAGCGKTPVRAGLGKGTSSTRAAIGAKSTAAFSRWGNAALGRHFFRNLLGRCEFLAQRLSQRYLPFRAKLSSA